ncbi:MAG TPA: hypothetical protein VKM55_16575 [Candidatus Lokiarchaeia archaeon]|nr:hypothetical protein [Candidatus Lokiarchaeia archaeon]
MVDDTTPGSGPLESTMIGFTARENRVGVILFWLLIAGVTVFFAGLLYTIADVIQPTGKASLFWAFPMGLKIIIIGAFMFGFFMLFVIFTVLYNRGTKALTKAVFSAAKMYRETKPSNGARFVTAGLMVAIFIIGAGIVVILFQLPSTNGHHGSGFLAFLDSLTVGEILLMLASVYLAFITLAILFVWVFSSGTVFFQKRFFSKN